MKTMRMSAYVLTTSGRRQAAPKGGPTSTGRRLGRKQEWMRKMRRAKTRRSILRGVYSQGKCYVSSCSGQYAPKIRSSAARMASR
jgi:hypothetical protein